jgi:hypothetical protein
LATRNNAKSDDGGAAAAGIDVTTEMHRRGINMRHLGLLRFTSRSSAMQHAYLLQIVMRTLKNLLRHGLRQAMNLNCSEYNLKQSVARFLNYITGSRFQDAVGVQINRATEQKQSSGQH